MALLAGRAAAAGLRAACGAGLPPGRLPAGGMHARMPRSASHRLCPAEPPPSLTPLQLVFKVEMSDLGWLGPAKNWIALAILVLVLVGIASERIHRMWCAMIGAGMMVRGRAAPRRRWQCEPAPHGCAGLLLLGGCAESSACLFVRAAARLAITACPLELPAISAKHPAPPPLTPDGPAAVDEHGTQPVAGG